MQLLVAEHAFCHGLQVRTTMNMLGPLLNPAGAVYGLIGVYSPDISMLMAQSLQQLGTRKALVVHSQVLCTWSGADKQCLTVCACIAHRGSCHQHDIYTSRIYKNVYTYIYIYIYVCDMRSVHAATSWMQCNMLLSAVACTCRPLLLFPHPLSRSSLISHLCGADSSFTGRLLLLHTAYATLCIQATDIVPQ